MTEQNNAQQQPQAQPGALKRGLVKQVLSGDSLVLQGPAQNGPPKEITVYLANVTAPRHEKRPAEGTEATPDEPYAWEAREFLRKKIVGQTVVFVREFTTTRGNEHGKVYLGGTSADNAENVVETGVSEGWLEVRPGKVSDEYTQKLLELQQKAKDAKKGRWSEDETSKHVRSIQWVVDDPRALISKYSGQQVDAIVEHVRDGSTVRVFLLPNFEYVTISLSGIKAPGVRVGSEGKPEEFGEQAKNFVESRLLQRDVKVVLESTSGQNIILGTVLHPRGNIAEFLLKEGYAKCVEWSIGSVTGGAQPLREAERYAKEHHLRLWKSYVGPATIAKNSFTAKVVEIGLGDSITVQKDNDEELKVYFSSLRPPRRGDGTDNAAAATRQFRPLFDIPYMFEAREFLRKKLLGKRVTVSVDYVQPKSDQFPEKTCCTVLLNTQNIAEALIARGLARALRHRNDDDNRSAQYDALLAAETEAENGKKGFWVTDKSETGTIRVQELQGDAQRSKQFLPYLQRSTRPQGIVEFITSGSRLRIYVPKETVIITFLLGGIDCPRGQRFGPGGKPIGENAPFAEDALRFTRSKCLQQEVQIEVESLDKAGSFIGYLFVPSEKGGHQNLSELLVENGLANVHFTAERSPYYNALLSAEKRAKAARLGLWKNYIEEDTEADKQIQAANDAVEERKMNLKKICVTEVYPGLHFAAQHFDDGPSIEKLMNSMQVDLKGAETGFGSRRGQLAATIFYELWHRIKVEGVKGDKVDVLYIDFGNRETISSTKIAALPAHFQSQAPYCREYQLALVGAPNGLDYEDECKSALWQMCEGKTPLMNVEYKIGSIEAVTLYLDLEQPDGTKQDVGKTLVADGHALVEKRRETRLQSLLQEYEEAEKESRRLRRNIWRYGDFTGNEI